MPCVSVLVVRWGENAMMRFALSYVTVTVLSNLPVLHAILMNNKKYNNNREHTGQPVKTGTSFRKNGHLGHAFQYMQKERWHTRFIIAR
jgi:hypothetical protein